MITITAMKWAPPFAAGNVRDHRARWILNEVKWPYQVRLIDAENLASEEYRNKQPFGQVPYLEEEGRPTLFESGAIVMDVASRADVLMGWGPNERSMVSCWVIAALNSIEPPLMNVAEVDYFIEDEEMKAARRPYVVNAAELRLNQLQVALDDRKWLVGSEFSAADLVMASVLKVARGLDLLSRFPALYGYQDRCLDRPAYRQAIADQCATISQHDISDMKYPI